MNQKPINCSSTSTVSKMLPLTNWPNRLVSQPQVNCWDIFSLQWSFLCSILLHKPEVQLRQLTNGGGQ